MPDFIEIDLHLDKEGLLSQVDPLERTHMELEGTLGDIVCRIRYADLKQIIALAFAGRNLSQLAGDPEASEIPALDAFFADRIELDPDHAIPARDVYDGYKQWAKATSEYCGSAVWFFVQFDRRFVGDGIAKVRTAHGYRYQGIYWKEEASPNPSKLAGEPEAADELFSNKFKPALGQPMQVHGPARRFIIDPSKFKTVPFETGWTGKLIPIPPTDLEKWAIEPKPENEPWPYPETLSTAVEEFLSIVPDYITGDGRTDFLFELASLLVYDQINKDEILGCLVKFNSERSFPALPLASLQLIVDLAFTSPKQFPTPPAPGEPTEQASSTPPEGSSGAPPSQFRRGDVFTYRSLMSHCRVSLEIGISDDPSGTKLLAIANELVTRDINKETAEEVLRSFNENCYTPALPAEVLQGILDSYPGNQPPQSPPPSGDHEGDRGVRPGEEPRPGPHQDDQALGRSDLPGDRSHPQDRTGAPGGDRGPAEGGEAGGSEPRGGQGEG